MKIYIVGCLLLVVSFLFGQKTVETKSLSEEYIYGLKSGATIVRLYMNKPKMDVLAKAINNPAVSVDKKKELQKQLEQHKTERKAYINKTINAFDSIYDFSNIYFIFDYDQKRFQNGERKNIFVGEEGEINSQITMKETFYLLLGRGGNDETFVFYQPDGKEMPVDFPDRYSANIIQGIIGLFKKDKLGNYIFRLNEKLHTYYNRVGIMD